MNLLAGYPFWLIKSGLPFVYPALERSIKTDVVIIGGGISGALAGYCLTNAGVGCIIVDGRTIGLGSTCASTSLLQYEIDTPLSKLKGMVGEQNAITAYKLCETAIEKLGKVAQNINYTEYEYKNSLYYAAHKKDSLFLKKEFEERKEAGFNVTYLDSVALQDQYGFTAPGAILSETGAQTNAYEFTHALLQYSTKKGMQVYDRTFVTGIQYHQNAVELTIQNGCRITAKKLIYANGYEAVNYIDRKIVDLHSTYATVSEQCNSNIEFWKDEVMIWNTADPYLYMRTTPDRRIIIGGRDESFNNVARRDKLINKKSLQLKRDFEKLFPSIEFRTEFSWTGIFGDTKDGLPYIGPYKKAPNSYFALGFGGNGITFSMIAAEMITEMITKGNTEHQSIFSFER